MDQSHGAVPSLTPKCSGALPVPCLFFPHLSALRSHCAVPSPPSCLALPAVGGISPLLPWAATGLRRAGRDAGRSTTPQRPCSSPTSSASLAGAEICAGLALTWLLGCLDVVSHPVHPALKEGERSGGVSCIHAFTVLCFIFPRPL